MTVPSSRRRAGPTWTDYRAGIGDRSSLFAAVVAQWGVKRALYVGSYLDLSPSTAIASVTYVDTDRRAARFFADDAAVAADLAGRTAGEAGSEVIFLADDFTSALPVEDSAYDLLIALYTGPAWNHCRRYLAPGGLFLANSSHGDASLAALDPDLELVGVIQHRGDRYRLDAHDLDAYLQPKKPETARADLILASGRGIAYTRPAFAYLFRRR